MNRASTHCASTHCASTHCASTPARSIRGARFAPIVAVLGVALFWIGTFVAAACKVRCPLGAAGCGFGANDAPGDWLDRAHVYGVAFNEFFLVAAMAALAFGPLRCAPWPRWLGVISVPLAVLSVILLSPTGGADNGLLQRLWVAVNATWLLVKVGAATRVVR